MTNANLRN